jgi:hypothetical protein
MGFAEAGANFRQKGNQFSYSSLARTDVKIVAIMTKSAATAMSAVKMSLSGLYPEPPSLIAGTSAEVSDPKRSAR